MKFIRIGDNLVNPAYIRVIHRSGRRLTTEFDKDTKLVIEFTTIQDARSTLNQIAEDLNGETN